MGTVDVDFGHDSAGGHRFRQPPLFQAVAQGSGGGAQLSGEAVDIAGVPVVGNADVAIGHHRVDQILEVRDRQVEIVALEGLDRGVEQPVKEGLEWYDDEKYEPESDL